MGLDIGAGELVLIFIIILIFWGPGKLPEMARTLGKAMRTLRKASYDFTSIITREAEKETATKTPPAKPRESEHQKLPPGARTMKPSPVAPPDDPERPAQK